MSPFSLCFSHVDDCPRCDYGERQLCPTGRTLFEAAVKAAEMIASAEPVETEAKA